MTMDDALKFANANPVCQLATAEGDQPHLRIMAMVTADQQGFWFATLTPKAMSRQLHGNPKIEICFFNNAQNPAEWKVMYVTGKAEFVKDDARLSKVMKERAPVGQIIGRSIEPYGELFCVRSGVARFWTLKESLDEEKLERVRF